MNIGIPKEIKAFEGRVSLTPLACKQLIDKGHTVFIERNAGILSGFDDDEYESAKVILCATAKDLYKQSELVVKVKEPLEADLEHLTSKHILFCFLHLAANANLVERLSDIGLIAIAFESVRDNNRLSLLKPMSEIAGKLAVQIGTSLLHLYRGGSGILLGGLESDSIDKGQVLILGAGAAGTQAALLAQNIGASVFIFDKSQAALDALTHLNPVINVVTEEEACLRLLASTNLLVGALLVPGKKNPASH